MLIAMRVASSILLALVVFWWLLSFLRPRFWTAARKRMTGVPLFVAAIALWLVSYFMPEILHFHK
jgi:hypothetical protein